MTQQKPNRSFDGLASSLTTTIHQPLSLPSNIDISDDSSQQQTYQNLGQINEHQMPVQNEIYANQEQIQQIQNSEGIYDNECVISAQLKTLAIGNKTNNSGPQSIENLNTYQCVKPPVAAKPSNLQQKIKALNNAGLSVSTVDKFIPPSANHDEPLKIIESDQDLYCNTKPLSMD